jgi:hypothetical protein
MEPSGETTMEQQDRVDQFKTEIADMRLRDPVSGRERVLLVIGVLLLVAGPIVTLVAYAQSSGTDNPLQQGDDHTIALIGVALAIVGAALFVRYSIGTLLRFWLARLSYEQQVQTDRVVAALAGPTASSAASAAAKSAPAPAARVASTPTST